MSRTEYTYDRMGRVKTITQIYYDNRTSQWVTFVEKAYQYDALGNVIKELDALGYAFGTGTAVDDKINSGYGTRYTYDLAGKLLTKLDPESGDKGLTFAEKYTYDALGRVTSMARPHRCTHCSTF